MTDVEVLAADLATRFQGLQVNPGYGWPERPALCAVDCVLSLNRKYRSTVLPRVRSLSERRPHLVSIRHLRTLVDSYESPHAFLLRELDNDHTDRADTLSGVVDYLLSQALDGASQDEWRDLCAWAAKARPGDYLTVGVRGFGLAGFQYLRMLFGTQTTKPDVHIIRYVSRVVGRKVNDVIALTLMEAAARSAGLPLREVDGAIWSEAASPGPTGASF